MKETGCENEDRVLEALGEGCQPELFSEPLREHLKSCAACAEIVSVYQLFQQDAAELRAAAPVPEAGRVWWRATLAARRAAAQRALRPILIAERIAWAVGAGALVALLAFAAPWLAEQMARLSISPSAVLTPVSLAYLIAISIIMGVLLIGGSLYALRSEK